MINIKAGGGWSFGTTYALNSHIVAIKQKSNGGASNATYIPADTYTAVDQPTNLNYFYPIKIRSGVFNQYNSSQAKLLIFTNLVL